MTELTGVHSPNITGDRAVHKKNMASVYLEKEEMITESVLKVRNVRSIKNYKKIVANMRKA